MKTALKARLLKFFRVTHGWLGIIVFPWIFVIGLTGFYLNHAQLVNGWLEREPYDESQFYDWPGARETPVADAARTAKNVWPDETVNSIREETYHGFDAYVFRKASGKIIVVRDTGHYFVKTNLSRSTFAPDGTRLDRKIYWKSVFAWLHERGWLDNTFGTWLADITAGAMVIFSLSGLYLFFAPRTKRIARRLRKLLPSKRSPAGTAPSKT